MMDLSAIRSDMISLDNLRLEDYRKLVGLAEEQKNILISGKNDGLQENLTAQDIVINELCQLDKRRELLSTRLEQADGESSDEFDRAIDEMERKLKESATDLHSFVQTNKELLSNAMQFVRFSISLLSFVTTNQPAYGPGTNTASAASAVVLDRTV